MLQLLPTEVGIVQGWAETALHRHGIPLPEEEDLLNKIKKTGSFRSIRLNDVELEVILIWADEGTRSHFGPGKFILDTEQKLIDRIHQYLSR